MNSGNEKRRLIARIAIWSSAGAIAEFLVFSLIGWLNPGLVLGILQVHTRDTVSHIRVAGGTITLQLTDYGLSWASKALSSTQQVNQVDTRAILLTNFSPVQNGAPGTVLLSKLSGPWTIQEFVNDKVSTHSVTIGANGTASDTVTFTPTTGDSWSGSSDRRYHNGAKKADCPGDYTKDSTQCEKISTISISLTGSAPATYYCVDKNGKCHIETVTLTD